MLTYNMDVEERSVWLRATPNNAVLAQPFYATEAGLFLWAFPLCHSPYRQGKLHPFLYPGRGWLD